MPQDRIAGLQLTVGQRKAFPDGLQYFLSARMDTPGVDPVPGNTGFFERMIHQEVPEIVNIIDVTDHEAGVTPYY